MVRRTLTAVLLLAVIGFCVIGFIATFEPNPLATQLMWRLIYGGIGTGCAVALVRLIVSSS